MYSASVPHRRGRRADAGVLNGTAADRAPSANGEHPHAARASAVARFHPPSRGLRAHAPGTPAVAPDRGRVRQIARRLAKTRLSHVKKGHFLYDAPGSIRRGRVGGSEGPREGRSAVPPQPGNEVRAQPRSYTDTPTPRMRPKSEAPAQAGARVSAHAGNAPSASLREAPPPLAAREGGKRERLNVARPLTVAFR